MKVKYKKKIINSMPEVVKKYFEKRRLSAKIKILCKKRVESKKSQAQEWDEKIRENRGVQKKIRGVKKEVKARIKPILKEENLIENYVKISGKKLQLQYEYKFLLLREKLRRGEIKKVTPLVYNKVNYKDLIKRLRGTKQYKGEIHDRERSPMAILSNILMKNGEGRRIECIMNKILRGLRVKMGLKMKFATFFKRANVNVSVKIGLFKRRISGIMRSIPVLLPAYKVKREAWKRIIHSAKGRTERTLELRVMNELIDAALNKGRSVKARNDRYKEIKKHKIWLKHIRY